MTATASAAPAKVYFTNLRTHARESQLDKLKRLIRRAGIEQIDFENKFVAIKIHFGELGNLSFLRPNYARAVADVVKELGGKPFLTDCNTLYVDSRKTRSSTSTPPTRTASPRMPRAVRLSSPTASKAPMRHSFRSRAVSTCTRPRSARHSWTPIS